MSNSIDPSTPINNQHQPLVVSKQFADEMINKINDSIVLTSQTTRTLQKHLRNLPNLIIQLAMLSPQNEKVITSLETANTWFNEVTSSQEPSSKKYTLQLSITELSAIENELLNWLSKHNIQDSTEIVQVLLQVGLRSYDLGILEQKIADSNVLPKVWSFLEFMLVAETMLHEIDLDLKQVSILVEAVNRTIRY